MRCRTCSPCPAALEAGAWTSRGWAWSTWRPPRPGCPSSPACRAALRRRCATARPGSSWTAGLSTTSPTPSCPCSLTRNARRAWEWQDATGPGTTGAGRLLAPDSGGSSMVRSPGQLRPPDGSGAGRSAPAQTRCHVGDDALHEVCVVVHPELIGHRDEHRVRSRDRLIPRKLLDQRVRLAGIRLAEPSPSALQEADLVLAARLESEVVPVEVTDQREDAATYRDPRLPAMTRLAPRVLED